MMNITVSGLIQYFEDRVLQKEHMRLGTQMGKEPYYPMLVLLLGDAAIRGFKYIANHLFQMWPSYLNEILFLGVSQRDGRIAYSELLLENEEVRSETIAMNEIGPRVSALFNLNSHFANKDNLLVYQIMDTTQLRDEKEFKLWINIMQAVKRAFVDPTQDTMEQLILLLNEETGGRQVTAAKIKNVLSETTANLNCATLLLSSRRNDRVRLTDWEIGYKLIASSIALSNNSDGQVVRPLFNTGVMVPAYAREEKPIHEIGQVVIEKTIEGLSQQSFGDKGTPAESKLVSGLGLSSDHTLRLLDEYVENKLAQSLPTEEQLELFPRNDLVDYSDISQISEREFNELTMGSWELYLSAIVDRIQETVSRDVAIRNEWKRKYSELLSASFSINELIWLRDHPDDVRNMLMSARRPSSEVIVLNAAKATIKYMLSTNRSITEFFLEIIREIGNNADEFLKKWDGLVRSGRIVHAVRDDSIIRFYNSKVQNYFDYNAAEITANFRKINSIPALEKYLSSLIVKMIESDPIYTAPFEVELEARLKFMASPVGAKQYIREKLVSENVPIYFQSKFQLSTPIASCVMLQSGTQLYSSLRASLPADTNYYNTGNDTYAEALYYYTITPDNLLSEVDE